MAQSQPVVIYTNLFTLEGKPVSSNKFIDMYIVWLTCLVKHANLQPTDACLTFIDEKTLAYVESSFEKRHLLNILASRLPNFKFIRYPQPSSIKEGILRRYHVDSILQNGPPQELNPSYFHLDIDVLVYKDIRNLLTGLPVSEGKTTLYLRNESTIDHSDYYGELMSDEEKAFLKTLKHPIPGFSAGIFGWNGNAHIHEFMRHILHHALRDSKTYYTVEQPFFNGAVFYYLCKDVEKINLCILNQDMIAHNKLDCFHHPTYVLGNYCGEPGDDSFHWNKIFHELISMLLK
jgi:hypothetical protein